MSLASYDASKPLMASLAQDMVESARSVTSDTFDVTVNDIDAKVRGKAFCSPQWFVALIN